MKEKMIKILAIDDNKDNLVVLKALLKGLFPLANVIIAQSGKKGIELCHVENPDVILLDIVMPEMDGYEVCMKLKADNRVGHIPVIMITAARIDKESRIIALEAGADAFLTKPIDKSELKAQIKAMLRIKESEDYKMQETERLNALVSERTKALEQEIEDRKRMETVLIESESKIKQHLYEQELLSEVSGKLVSIQNKDEIYDLIGKQVHNICNDAFVLVNTYNFEKKSIRLKYIFGFNAFVGTIKKQIGYDPFILDIPIKEYSPEILSVLKSRKLSLITENCLFNISAGKINKRTSAIIEKSLGVKSAFIMGFTWDEKLYGAVVILVKDSSSFAWQKLIEPMINLASVALQRLFTDERLRAERINLNALFTSSPVPMLLIDKGLLIKQANPAVARLFHTEPGELKNKMCGDFLGCVNRLKHEEGCGNSENCKACNIMNSIKKALTEKLSIYEQETEIIQETDAGQRSLWLTFNIEPVSINHKTYIVLSLNDITNRKLSEVALKESEERLSSIFRVSPIGIGVVKDRVIIDVNPQIFEMTGYTPEELIGVDSRIFYSSQEEYDYVGKEKYDQISKTSVGIVETQWRRKDGRFINVFLASTYLSPENPSQGITFTALDITKRKLMETELIAAKEKAEESDRLKTSFLHNISHEIRTPLNAIVGFSSLLNDPNLNYERLKSYTDIIKQSSSELLTIITDIINISTIEAGKLKAYEKETNINTILYNLYEEFQVKFAKKNLLFITNSALSEEEARLMADETKLVQIISNLISNALKFTEKGKVELGCSIHNNFLQFYCKDTGIGIPPEFHQIIFERFRQIDFSDTRNYGGMGLGLPIVKSYVELLGGNIWFESEKGIGSVFYFTLPYKPIWLKEMVKESGRSEEVKPVQKNVLIVEDDEMNAMLLEEILAESNINVFHAWNGIEAVEMCKKNITIGMVLMDIKMPVMDGYEAMSLIKNIKPQLPVIAQTAYALSGDRQKLLAHGFDDYISKPLNKQKLAVILNNYLFKDN